MTIIHDLMLNHDKDPAGTATSLQALSPDSLEEKDIPTYSWLLNHVLGELVGNWHAACERQRQTALLRQASPILHFNHAIAASYAGQPLESWCATSRFAQAKGISTEEAEIIIRQGVLQHSAAGAETSDAFREVLSDCLAHTSDWHGSPQAAGMLASSLSNIVSRWLEQPLDSSAPVNAFMQEAARRSQSLWGAGEGNWLNAERACYLRALVANHLSNWQEACTAAREGITIIDENGEEDVDRACLLLELSRAQGALGQRDEQVAHRQQAIALADTFPQTFPDEPELRDWFDGLLKKAEYPAQT